MIPESETSSLIENYVLSYNDRDCNSSEMAKDVLHNMMPLAWTLSILTVLSNSIIIMFTFLLLKRGEEPRCTYMLLGNIAVSDFLTGILQIIELAPVNIIFNDETWLCCVFIAGINTAITLVSIYSVLLISVDRFLYIIHGIRYNQLMLPHKTGLMILGVWSFGIILGIVPLLIWTNESSKDDLCWYTQIAQPELVIVMAVLGILPVIYVLMLYSIILYKALKNIITIKKMMPKISKKESVKNIKFYKGKVKQKQKIIDDENRVAIVSKKCYSLQIYTVTLNENEDGSDKCKLEYSGYVSKNKYSAPSECKAIKVVILTTSCFALTWVPYFILSISLVTTDNLETWCNLLVATRVASYVGALNSFLNPFIYAWWHNRFRKSVRSLYCRRRKKAVVPQPDKSNT